MIKRLIALTAVALCAVASPATAEVIDFDTLAPGTVVTNQFAGVTFSTNPGSNVLVATGSVSSSAPNFICSAVGSVINCRSVIIVDFAGGVDALSFVAVGDGNFGVNGLVEVFNAGGLLGSVNIVGDGDPSTPFTVDIGAFAAVTRISINNSDGEDGLGLDDFSFQFTAAPGSVPEPATWAMMLIGFGAIGAEMRRRRPRASLVQAA